MRSMKMATNERTRPHPVRIIGREGATEREKFKTNGLHISRYSLVVTYPTTDQLI